MTTSLEERASRKKGMQKLWQTEKMQLIADLQSANKDQLSRELPSQVQ